MIYVSTLMYGEESFLKVLNVIEEYEGKVGIEWFPRVHSDRHIELLKENLDKLKKYPFSFHEPCFGTDHAAEKNSEIHEITMNSFKKILEFGDDLKPEYIVFHFNNSRISNRKKMIENAFADLEELKALTDIPIVLENTGVEMSNNVLFNEEEFIEMAKEREENILIDIGHANANGWDFENLISQLKDKIVSYHLHSNDGRNDSHSRIFENTPDMDYLLDLIKKFTPEADLVIEYNREFELQEDLVKEDIRKLLAKME